MQTLKDGMPKIHIPEVISHGGEKFGAAGSHEINMKDLFEEKASKNALLKSKMETDKAIEEGASVRPSQKMTRMKRESPSASENSGEKDSQS